MSGLEARNGEHNAPANGKPAPTRGDTVSWLVGGPAARQWRRPVAPSRAGLTRPSADLVEIDADGVGRRA